MKENLNHKSVHLYKMPFGKNLEQANLRQTVTEEKPHGNIKMQRVIGMSQGVNAQTEHCNGQ